MKQSIFTIASAIALTMGTINSGAQTVSFKTVLKQAADSITNAVVDKKEERISVKNSSQSATASNTAELNVAGKALKDFSKKFNGVTNEYWEKAAEGGYSVNFNKDDTRIIIYYDKKGNWKGSLKSYQQDKLPGKIKQAVMSEYYNATINYAHEILTPASEGEPTYLIQLADKKYMFEVRYHNGEMEVWKQYDKQ